MVYINSSGCRWRHCKSRDSGFDPYGSQFVLKSSSQNIKINVPGKVACWSVEVLGGLVGCQWHHVCFKSSPSPHDWSASWGRFYGKQCSAKLNTSSSAKQLNMSIFNKNAWVILFYNCLLIYILFWFFIFWFTVQTPTPSATGGFASLFLQY